MLAIDASTPSIVTQTSGSIATITTASFTPPDGSLLLIRWSSNSHHAINPSTPTITDSLGVPLVYTIVDWVSRADSPTVDGQAACWWAQVNTSAAMTVTVTSGAADNRQAALCVTVLTGHDPLAPIGASGKSGSTSTSTISQDYTGLASNAWGFIVDCDWDDKGAQTAGTGCTLTDGGSASITGQISWGFARRTSADDTNGGTTTLNLTLPGTSTNLSWIYVEILPPAIPDDPFSPWAAPLPPWLMLLIAAQQQQRPETTVTPSTTGPPTLVIYEETSWSTTTNPKDSGTISWLTGDVIVVIGGTEAQSVTITSVTATGLTFTPGSALAVAGTCWANTWTATAGSSGSSVVTIDKSGAGQYGAAIWVYRGSTGFGARAVDSTSTKTLSLTRTGSSSVVVEGLFDFSAAVVTGHVWTPGSQNEREALNQSGYTPYIADWPDQGAPGSTSYGITGTASVGLHTKVALEIFGSPTSNSQTLLANAITSSESIGNPTITPGSITVAASGIASSEISGNSITAIAASSQGVNANGMLSSEILGQVSVTSIFTANANNIASSELIGAPVVTTTVSISANSISSSETFGNANAITATSVLVQGIPSSEAIGQPLVTTITTIPANSIGSSERLGATTVTTTVAVGTNGIPTAENIGSASVSTVSNITTNSITSSETFGNSTVTTTYTVNANGIQSSETFGSSNAITATSVLAQGIPSQERFGASTVTPGSVTVATSSITSGESVGFAAISVGVSTIVAGSISSNERVGSPAVTPGSVTVTANSITSSEILGSVSVSAGASNVTANGIVSSTSFGSPTIAVGPVTVTTNSITTSEAFGNTTVTTTYTINANGIKSSETIGQVAAGTVTNLIAAGISTTERLGSPSITAGSVTVTAGSINSSERFGSSITSLGFLAQTISAFGITTNVTVGYPHTGPQVIDIIMTIASDTSFVLPANIVATITSTSITSKATADTIARMVDTNIDAE